MVSYRAPSEPSRTRVYLWRKLKELGAVYLQQGVAVLPLTDSLLVVVEALRAEMAASGGSVMTGKMTFVNSDDDDWVVAAFQEQRDADYDEIVEQCDRLTCELGCETREKKFTYAEIEENETELARIHKWMERVVARDWFSASGRARAELAVRRAEESSQAYTGEVECRKGHVADIEPPERHHC